MKSNKYHNNKVQYDGYLFASKRERDRYVVLKEAERKGEITDLELQPKFELVPKLTEKIIEHKKTKDVVKEKFIQHPITYTADFAYTKDGERIIEDVKISPDVLPKELTLKIKMMRYFHGIEVRLVYKANEEI